MPAAGSTPEISLVVPFFNEEEAAYGVVDEIGGALEEFGGAWEAILVDDGSTDRTAGELERGRRAWTRCRILRLPANCGQGPALYRGIAEARAPRIATMDGDGQNPPGEVATLLPLLEFADLAVGVRTPRRDSLLRRGLSRLANRVRGRLIGDGVSDAGCALKVFRREVAGSFRPVPMLNCFMPAFAIAAGFRVAERPVRHRPRRAGRAKYGLRVMAWHPFWEMLAVRRMLRQTGAGRAGSC